MYSDLVPYSLRLILSLLRSVSTPELITDWSRTRVPVGTPYLKWHLNKERLYSHDPRTRWYKQSVADIRRESRFQPLFLVSEGSIPSKTRRVQLKVLFSSRIVDLYLHGGVLSLGLPRRCHRWCERQSWMVNLRRCKENPSHYIQVIPSVPTTNNNGLVVISFHFVRFRNYRRFIIIWLRNR